MLLSKRIIYFVVTLFIISMVISGTSYAYTYLTKEKALQEVFGTECTFTTESVRLKDSLLKSIKNRLGGKLVYYQDGSESENVLEQKKIEFYYAVKDGKKIGIAIIDTQPGKWGPVEFIIGMDLKPNVTNVAVMRFREKRGRPIANKSFMNQYTGKNSRSPLNVGDDIVAVSGATISSRAATFAVKKALVLVEECLHIKSAKENINFRKIYL